MLPLLLQIIRRRLVRRAQPQQHRHQSVNVIAVQMRNKNLRNGRGQYPRELQLSNGPLAGVEQIGLSAQAEDGAGAVAMHGGGAASGAQEGDCEFHVHAFFEGVFVGREGGAYVGLDGFHSAEGLFF